MPDFDVGGLVDVVSAHLEGRTGRDEIDAFLVANDIDRPEWESVAYFDMVGDIRRLKEAVADREALESADLEKELSAIGHELSRRLEHDPLDIEAHALHEQIGRLWRVALDSHGTTTPMPLSMKWEVLALSEACKHRAADVDLNLDLIRGMRLVANKAEGWAQIAQAERIAAETTSGAIADVNDHIKAVDERLKRLADGLTSAYPLAGLVDVMAPPSVSPLIAITSSISEQVAASIPKPAALLGLSESLKPAALLGLSESINGWLRTAHLEQLRAFEALLVERAEAEALKAALSNKLEAHKHARRKALAKWRECSYRPPRIRPHSHPPPCPRHVRPATPAHAPPVDRPTRLKRVPVLE